MSVPRSMLVAVVLATLLVAPVAAVPGSGPAATGAGPTDGGVATAAVDETGPAPSVGHEGQADECEFPVEYEDATGTTVRVADDPERIVTLAPSAAQTMWEIDGRDEVVGVSQFAAYLDGAGAKANVSAPGFGNYDVERIVALEPDLVLAPNVVGNETVEQLRGTGLTVVKFSAASSIDDVRQKTTLIGRLTGHCAGAAEANRWMDRNLEAVRGAVEDRERKGAVYVLGTFTAGQGTFIDDMISTAGGRNVMAEAGVTGYKPLNKEIVAERNPSWVIVDRPGTGVLEQAPYNQTTAGEEGNLVVVNPNYVNQPAPRSVVYAVRNLTEAFHGDAFGRADYVSRSAVAVTTTTTTTTATTTTRGTSTTTTTADDGGATTTTTTADDGGAPDDGGQSTPGFGIPAAAVAMLIVVALLARRRSD